MSFATIRGLVLEDLCRTLPDIQVADGYQFDVQEDSVFSEPTNLLTLAEPSLPALQVEVSRPESRRKFWPAMQLEEHMAFVLTARLTANGLLTHRKLEAAENFAGDVEKVLTVDITRGGLCVDTRVGVHEVFTGLGQNNNVMLLIPVLCHWHRTYGTP